MGHPLFRGERGKAGACWVCLRYMPVLAVLAPEIAPDAAKRIREGAGQVMEERFFLDGIYRFGTHEAVRGGIQCPAGILPDPADPVFPVGNRAAVVAQRTLHRPVLSLYVLACFMHTRSRPSTPRLFLCITSARLVVHFKDKRSPVFAALADRTAQHGRNFLRTTLYEHPVQKLVQ